MIEGSAEKGVYNLVVIHASFAIASIQISALKPDYSYPLYGLYTLYSSMLHHAIEWISVCIFLM